MHMITLDKVLFLNDYLDSFPIELCCDEVTRRGLNYVSCANTYLVKKTLFLGVILNETHIVHNTVRCHVREKKT